MKTFEIFDSEDHVSREAVASSATSLLPSETVLLVTRSGILRHTLPVALARVPVTVNQDLKALMPDRELLPKYLAYGIRAFGQQILHSCVKDGTTVQSVEFSDLKHFQIPIAPSREQQRIADALDELLSDLDAGVEALQRAQAKLALYRASVLKAAVQGDLTAEWRKQHPNAEPAPVLLQRILVERRQRWEQEQLRKFKAAGKTPPANWKAKYREPIAPDTTNLPPLPEGWCWASVEQLSSVIVDCPHSTPVFVERGRPCVDTTCISPAGIVLSAIRHVTEETYLNRVSRLTPQEGDIVFAREGTVGTAVILPPDFNPCLGQRVMLMRCSSGVLPKHLKAALDSAFIRDQYQSKIQGSTVDHLNVGDVKQLAVPLAHFEEQSAIAELIDNQVDWIDRLNADVPSKIGRARALKQSILRHAFTGQLVPQDSKDEPASELLKRIVAEREARKKTKATPRKQTTKRQKREK